MSFLTLLDSRSDVRGRGMPPLTVARNCDPVLTEGRRLADPGGSPCGVKDRIVSEGRGLTFSLGVRGIVPPNVWGDELRQCF